MGRFELSEHSALADRLLTAPGHGICSARRNMPARVPSRLTPAVAVSAAVAALLLAGCSFRRPPATPAAQPPPPAPVAPAAAAPAATPERPAGTAEAPRPGLRDLCRQPDEGALLDDTRRVLEETFCGAALWFDGLFGGEPDVENARAVSGRAEISTLYTQDRKSTRLNS